MRAAPSPAAQAALPGVKPAARTSASLPALSPGGKRDILPGESPRSSLARSGAAPRSTIPKPQPGDPKGPYRPEPLSPGVPSASTASHSASVDASKPGAAQEEGQEKLPERPRRTCLPSRLFIRQQWCLALTHFV